jgi:uncharacterized protein with HEPN domain
MSHDRQRLADYLAHIVEAIERIGRYTDGMDKPEFLQNPMAQDAVIRNFEVIGEASHNIEKEHAAFAAQHTDLPLGPAYQMRNALAHGYFKVDMDLVWNTIHRDLPRLRELAKRLGEGLQGG